ncbi:MAG TPA: PilZ domain-containing protein [Nitrospiraceae bacterium]|nr:PilZ domain-containing protein [Nitrospiraceae bacterium]
MKKFVNRRFAPRVYSQFPVPISIIYRGQDSAGEGIVQEVSRMGCRILGSNDSMVVGKTLSVRLSLATSQQSLFIGRATVKWVKGLEFGLAFKQLPPREADRLEHLLEEFVESGRYNGRPAGSLKVKPPAA